MSLSVHRLDFEMPMDVPIETSDDQLGQNVKMLFSIMREKVTKLLDEVLGNPVRERKLVENRKHHWPYV